MKKYLAILFTSMVLAGCTTVTIDQPVVELDPSWPTPVKQPKLNWAVIDQNDNPYVALTYQQSLDMRVWLEDIKRYIKDSNSMICFYRSSLKEERCKNEK